MMENEGLISIIRKTTRYIVPCQQRRLASLAASKAIFNEDMRYKTKFLLRKNRPDPLAGQITT